LNIEVRKIKELKYAGYNPRKKLKDGDPEYTKLKRSIEHFGYVDPVIVNKDGTIIGGHQRFTVLKDLGYDEIDCVIVDLNKEDEKALNVALNKVSGAWDMGMLKDLMLELADEKYDTTLAGFDQKEFDKLIADPAKKIQGEVEISPELMESHNYVVLYFDNDMDWKMAMDKLNIQTVKAQDSREGYERKGIGKVIKGAEIIGRI
jgi:ParB-like chromosome segregation protein Spo0J